MTDTSPKTGTFLNLRPYKPFLKTEAQTLRFKPLTSKMVRQNRHNTSIKMFTDALEQLADIFCIYDEDYRLVYANSAAFEALPIYFTALSEGLTILEGIRKVVKHDRPELDASGVEKRSLMLNERVKQHAPYEIRGSKDRVFRVRNEILNNQFTFSSGVDVTKLKAQKVRMERLAKENFHIANTDQLTGLANRRHFIKTLEKEISNNQTGDKSFFVGLIDLNGFKRINDIYGHTIGDELLENFAQRASERIDPDTFLARLGGDEFALINRSGFSKTELLMFSDELCKALSLPQKLSGNTLSVSASLGWASFPKDGKTTSDLLRKSDYALYKCKNSKTRKSVIFSNLDETVLRHQSEISIQLETANLEEEIHLKYQPIHDIFTNKVIGFEALMRWENSKLGPLNPEDFIPLAEKTGCISKLSKIGLKQALDTAKTWPESIEIHYNISAIDLGKMDIMQELVQIVKDSGYPTQSVVFEVTETALMDTLDSIANVFALIKETGVQLALDDFGVGFSSLSYLARIPVTCLKVDKSFTERLQPGSDEEQILKTIKQLSENLGIGSIIEGVETQSQLDQLGALGLNVMQGFHFSESLDPQDIAAYLLNHVANHMPVFNVSSPSNSSQVRHPAQIEIQKLKAG